jgi:hypothetical protein
VSLNAPWRKGPDRPQPASRCESAGGPRTFAALVSLLALSAPALAAEPAGAKAACARSAEEGQRLRKLGQLREALAAFTACSADHCPALIRGDCGGWLSEVESALPTVVVRATAAEDPTQELYDVAVSVDGAALTGKLDGGALPVNPGEHRFSFVAAGRKPAEQTVVVRVGEQHRLLAVTLSSDRPPPVVVEKPPPPPRVGTTAKVLLVVGGAGVVAAGALGTAGWLQTRSLRDSGCAPACDAGKVNGIKTLLRASDIALGAGAAALLGAAGFIWLGSDSPVEVTPVTGGATVGLRWKGPRGW